MQLMLLEAHVFGGYGKARADSEFAGLRSIGTIGILLNELKNHELDFGRFSGALQAIVRAGFYLTEGACLRVIEVAGAIAASQTE